MSDGCGEDVTDPPLLRSSATVPTGAAARCGGRDQSDRCRGSQVRQLRVEFGVNVRSVSVCCRLGGAPLVLDRRELLAQPLDRRIRRLLGQFMRAERLTCWSACASASRCREQRLGHGDVVELGPLGTASTLYLDHALAQL